MTEEDIKFIIMKYVKNECLIDREEEINEKLLKIKRDNDFEIESFCLKYDDDGYEWLEITFLIPKLKTKLNKKLITKIIEVENYYRSKVGYNAKFKLKEIK